MTANAIPLKPIAVKTRITHVETTYYQVMGDQPSAVESRFVRPVQTENERPYQRQLKVGPEWQELDYGWLDGNVGMLILSNEAGKGRQVIPSPQEVEATGRLVVEVGDWLVPPGESFRGTPRGPSGVRVRCPAGEVLCILTVFPK